MFLSILLLHCALLVPTSAIPWLAPAKTTWRSQEAAVDAPTAVQNLARAEEPTAYPVSLCGWVAGDGELPAWCSSSSSCVWHTDYSMVGCCAIYSDRCAIYTSCVDKNSPKPDADKTDVYTCRGTSECYQNTYPGGYTQWGCGSSDWATTVLTSFSDYDTNLAFFIAVTGTDSQAASTTESTEPTPTEEETTSELEAASRETSTEVDAAAPPRGIPPVASFPSAPSRRPPPAASYIDTSSTSVNVASSTADAAAETTTSTVEGESSGTPTGAIAGGVVGGIAGLGIVAAGVFYFLRSRRARDDGSSEQHDHEGDDVPGPGGSASHDPQMAELYSPRQTPNPNEFHSPKQSPGLSELCSPSQSPDPTRTVSTISQSFQGKATPPVELP